MRRGISILVTAIVVAIAAGSVFYLTHGRARGAASNPPLAPLAVPIIAGGVNSGDVPIYLRGIGTVIAYNTVVVRSQIQGQITKITFTEGQTVKAGDTLAQIDPRPYQAQLDQMMATRDRDQAQLTNSLANLDRYNQLLAKGDATIQLADTQKAQVTQLQSAIKSDEPISVIFTLPETELPEIQQEMAKGPLTVLAYSHDDKIKLDEGKLALVNNEILQTTGTIQLKADFPNTAHMLWPGELINARLLLETRHNGISIASSAVQQGPNGAYVYVVGPDRMVEMRAVTVAEISEGQALIDSGLKPNETVVLEGQYRLQPGSLVEELHGKAAESAGLQSAVEQAIP